MPFYEYRCRQCGNEFETMRAMKDRDEALPCPRCESVATERKISTFASTSAGPATAPCGAPKPPRGCGGGFG